MPPTVQALSVGEGTAIRWRCASRLWHRERLGCPVWEVVGVPISSAIVFRESACSEAQGCRLGPCPPLTPPPSASWSPESKIARRRCRPKAVEPIQFRCRVHPYQPPSAVVLPETATWRCCGGTRSTPVPAQWFALTEECSDRRRQTSLSPAGRGGLAAAERPAVIRLSTGVFAETLSGPAKSVTRYAWGMKRGGTSVGGSGQMPRSDSAVIRQSKCRSLSLKVADQ